MSDPSAQEVKAEIKVRIYHYLNGHLPVALKDKLNSSDTEVLVGAIADWVIYDKNLSLLGSLESRHTKTSKDSKFIQALKKL